MFGVSELHQFGAKCSSVSNSCTQIYRKRTRIKDEYTGSNSEIKEYNIIYSIIIIISIHYTPFIFFTHFIDLFVIVIMYPN